MSNEILVAVISVTGSIVIAAISYFLTKRQQREIDWRNLKLDHYRNLLMSISDLAVDNTDVEAHYRFAQAINTIALVAPQNVIEAMLEFHDGVKQSNEHRSQFLHDKLLAKLLFTIRKDLKLRPKDNINTFNYHLVGAPPRKNQQ